MHKKAKLEYQSYDSENVLGRCLISLSKIKDLIRVNISNTFGSANVVQKGFELVGKDLSKNPDAVIFRHNFWYNGGVPYTNEKVTCYSSKDDVYPKETIYFKDKYNYEISRSGSLNPHLL